MRVLHSPFLLIFVICFVCLRVFAPLYSICERERERVSTSVLVVACFFDFLLLVVVDESRLKIQ